MEPIGISVVRTDEASVYAKYYYYESPTVYVEIMGINSPNSEWRISGRHSLGDTNIYLSEKGLGTFTFDSGDNMSYVLQIQNWNNDWVNTTNMYGEPQENSIINVDFEYGSDGDSGGGDSGSGGYIGANTMYINPGEGTKITVYRTWSDNEANRYQYLAKDITEPTTVVAYYPNDRFHITASALPGYEIDYYDDDFPFYTENLSRFWSDDYGGVWRYRPIDDLSISVYATATRSSCICIDDGSSFDNRYYCYIDTEHVEYPASELNCAIVGQRSGYASGSGNMAWLNSTSSYSTKYNDKWNAGYDSSGSRYYVYFLKFITPEFNSVSTGLKIEIKMGYNDVYSEKDPTVHYALCTSDENYNLYLNTLSSVNDPYQIATGTFQEVNGDGKVSTILIQTNKLQSNTTYYLLAWDAHSDNIIATSTTVMPASNHTVTLTCDTSGGPTYYTQFDPYVPYIDNGTSWEPL